MGESTDNPDQKEKWTKTLSERYGVQISVTLPPKADVTTFLTTHIAAGDLKGMVYRYSPDDVVQAIYEGYILPVDEYLKDNATWNALPEAMRNNYKIDGKIWAIPRSLGGYGNGAMWSRWFRKDWLTALGLETPKTFEDTKSVVTAFAQKDPDGDGKNSNNVGITFGGSMTYMDLFAAQDALTFEQGNNIGYHPETNAFEDAYLRPGAKSVFEFFRYVYQNGICDTTAFTVGFTDLRTKLNSGIIGSVFFYGSQGKYTFGPAVYNLMLKKTENRAADYNKYPSDWTKATNIYTEVSMITGTRTKNTWFTTYDGGPWTLMKGTDQPKETVNFFVDLMYSSESNFIESLWNLKEYWTKNADGSFTRQYKDAANKVGYAGANLISYVEPTLYPYKTYNKFYYPDTTAADKARSQERIEYAAARDAAGLASGQLYTIKAEYKTIRSNTYNKMSGDVGNYVKQLIVECATNKNITVDKALADYKKNMANIGGDKILAEANAAFGLTNNYQSYSK